MTMTVGIRSWLWLGVALVSTACGNGRQPFSQRVEELGIHVGELRSGLSAHDIQVATASMPSIAMVEDEHQGDALAHLQAMQADLGAMSACTGAAGRSPDTSAMGAMVESATTECERHHATMAQAADLVAAMTEESRHQQTMATTLDTMSAERDAMMRAGAGCTCPMGWMM